MSFAEGTSVSVEKTKAEIEKTLMRYGANSFASGWDGNKVSLQFQMNKRIVRFNLTMPDRLEKRFLMTPRGRYKRTDDEAFKAWEQACRQRWRALFLVVKAKLEAVDTGITTFENEFLAQILLPDGGTVGTWMMPQLEKVYSSGKMPSLMIESKP